MASRRNGKTLTPPAAPPRRVLRSVTAAATPIRLHDPKDVKRSLALREDWQAQAEAYLHAVGELKNCATLIGDSFARVRLVAAEVPTDPTQTPTETSNAQAREVLRSLESGDGPQQIMRMLGILLTITGEAQLIGIAPRFDPKTGETSEERYFVVSSRELKQKSGQLSVNDPYDGREIRLYGEDSPDRPNGQEPDFWARIWRPDPVERRKADSAVRSILDVLEDLLVCGRYFRAVARSQTSRSTIVYVPDDISWGNTDPTTDSAGDQEGLDDPLNQELLDYFAEPARNEDSAASVAPWLLRGPRDPNGSGIDVIEFPRTLDQLILSWHDAAQKRFAQGINLPVEFVFGLGEANHWGAGQIEESAYRQYLEPGVMLATAGLTNGWYRPALRAASVANPERYMVYGDPTALTIDKERRAVTIQAHGEGLISDETARADLGYDETDAPSPEEQERRLAMRRGILVGDVTEELLRRTLAPDLVVPHLTPSGVVIETPTADQEGEPVDGGAGTPVTAAATNLGQRLAAMDRDTATRLQTLLDQLVTRALEHAGAVLRSRSERNKAVQAAIRGVERDQIAATLGRTLVASLGVDDLELVRDVIDRGMPKIRRVLARAQDAALALVPRLSNEAQTEALMQQEADLDETVTWLRDELYTLAVARLYDPNPAAPEQGEHDPDSTVPYMLVRETMARAGGAGRAGADVQAAGRLRRALSALFGLATGYLVRKLIVAAGLREEGYQWDYGAAPRRRPFEPHQQLEGTTWIEWDDPALENTEGYPPVSHFSPGDHSGCLCLAIPVLVEPRDVETGDEPLEVAASARRRL